MKVFTAQQMRDFDRAAVEEYGIPSIVLMENAALRVVEFLEAKFAPLEDKKIVILCGKGNNGGDGLAIARQLVNIISGARLTVMMGPVTDYEGDSAINRQAWEQEDCFVPGEDEGYHRSAIWLDDQGRPENRFVPHSISRADIIVDAMLGTGFKGELREPILDAFMSMVGCGASRVYIDLPSGLDADNGESAQGIPDDNWQPQFTVTFAAPKRGFFVRDAMERCGEIWLGDIGTVPRQMKRTNTGVKTLDLETAKDLIPQRTLDAHKGDAGRALIIGGSFGMSGAVALAARAALGSGCGLCIAALPEKILPTFAASILEATSHPLPCDERGRLLESAADALPELWEGVQVVALGPGIGRADETFALVRRIVRECPVPRVIDADALHALPAIADEVKNRAGETILTPHPGEMGVLLDISAKEVNENRFEIAQRCAEKYGAIVVLKGARSLVATPDGRVFVNLSGNAGMATGGSGDVLTGTIAGLLAQMKHPEDATKLGVYLHGFAGDLAFEAKGNGLVAGDIAAHLGRALVEIPQREVEKINGRLRRLM